MRAAVAAVALLAVLSGCSAHSGPEVATAKRAVAAGATAPSPSASRETDYDKALRYTRCMNDNGTRMADPVIGTPLPTGDAISGGGWHRATNAAFDTCKKYLPATWPVTEDPATIARDRPFFECLRRHGIDAGEVDANGMIHYPADPTTQDTPAYRAAEAACRYLVDDPANNR